MREILYYAWVAIFGGGLGWLMDVQWGRTELEGIALGESFGPFGVIVIDLLMYPQSRK